MAKKPVFPILEDSVTLAGVSWTARQAGNASASFNAAPVLNAIDTAGNFQYLSLKTAGEAAAGVLSMAVLPAMDLAGALRPIALRDEGAASAGVDSVPGLVAKTSAGNLAYIPLNADGEVIVSNSPNGTPDFAADTAVGIIGTPVDVVTMSLVASEVYENIFIMPVSSEFTLWELVQSDDAVETVKGYAMTGPGLYNQEAKLENLEITAGATGVQSLILRGTQIQGTADDLFGQIGIFQKA